jgi:hypothetical protein
MAISVTPLNTTATPANTSSLIAESGLVNALYQEEGTATQAAGTQAALSTEAAGTLAEGTQYGQAATIAGGNAQLATLSGQLQEYQNTRTLMNTLGTQAADISGAGFANSGSALYLARSSLQQGLLQNQVLGLNAQLEAGGYLEQQQASEAEEQAANTAAATESSEASTAGSLSALATSQEATTANFLKQIPGVTVAGSGTNLTVTNTPVTAKEPGVGGAPGSNLLTNVVA